MKDLKLKKAEGGLRDRQHVFKNFRKVQCGNLDVIIKVSEEKF